MVMTARSQPGFSLIEILVVMAIIGILAALIVVSAKSFGVGSKRERSTAILGGLLQVVELQAAEHGSRPSPAEHPLAASEEPRGIFLRALGISVAATGEALVGVPAIQVRGADRARVLGPDDRFADPKVPTLYGMERSQLGILGVRAAGVTQFRKLPQSITPTDNPATMGFVDQGEGTAQASVGFMEQLLDRAGNRGDLLALGALRHAADDAIFPLANGRVLSPDAEHDGLDHWEPGRLAEGVLPSGMTSWRRYVLPGLSIVDAWGVEILYYLDDFGHHHFVSAGADGCFAVAPGDNHTVDTLDPFAPPSGDDHDGQHDNIQVGSGINR